MVEVSLNVSDYFNRMQRKMLFNLKVSLLRPSKFPLIYINDRGRLMTFELVSNALSIEVIENLWAEFKYLITMLISNASVMIEVGLMIINKLTSNLMSGFG